MKKLLLRGLLYGLMSVFFLSAGLQKAEASHAMGLDINYECIGGNQYKIWVTFYRDCFGIPAPTDFDVDISSPCTGFMSTVTAFPDILIIGADTLYSGLEVSPLCDADLSNSTCNGGTLPGVQVYVYSVVVNLPNLCDTWVMSVSECCRNALIDNLVTPGSWNLYAETQISIDSLICNNSPFFSELPVTYICTGIPFFYNHGAVDAEGDSLVYTLIDPMDAAATIIPHVSPTSATYPLTTVSGTFGFDSESGMMTLTPDVEQVGVVTIRVDEYRAGVWIGSTMRDLQVIVRDCANTPPLTAGVSNVLGGIPADSMTVQVCPGDFVSFDVLVTDPDPGDILTLSTNVDVAIPAATLSFSGINPATASFSWATSIADTGVYFFTLGAQDDACPVVGSQTFTFIVEVLGGTKAGPDQTYCAGGAPIQLEATGGSVFSWTPSTGLSDPSIANPLATPSVTTTYVVTSDLPASCDNTDTVTVFVTPENIDAGPDLLICDYQTLVISPVVTATPPAGGYTYNWTPSTGLSASNVLSPIVSPTGTDMVYVVTTTNFDGCILTDTILVSADNDPASVSPDVTDCPGFPVQLLASGGDSYLWDPSSTLDCFDCPDPVSVSNLPQTYAVYISKPNGCTDTLFSEVDRYTLPPLGLNAGGIIINLGQSLELVVDPGYATYLWNPTESIIGSFNQNVALAQPQWTTWFSVEAEDANGCIVQDSILVIVDDQQLLVVPNVFSPNGDGSNDVLHITYTGVAHLLRFEIFNRWGEQVFSTVDLGEGWDGTYRGKMQEVGTYVFNVDFINLNGDRIVKAGNVTLMR